MSNMVKKANAFEILNHWALAGSFFILTVTGFGFLLHLEQMNSIFGSFNSMRLWHNWAGVVFIASLFLTIFDYLPVSLRFSSDDLAWLFKGGGYFSRKAKMPPQDRLNAGQKLYYLFILAVGTVIAASGLVIWLRPVSADINRLVLLSHLFHNISFDLLVIAVPLHIYLASLANPGTLRIMITGTVPVEWARKRHEKWVKSLGL